MPPLWWRLKEEKDEEESTISFSGNYGLPIVIPER